MNSHLLLLGVSLPDSFTDDLKQAGYFLHVAKTEVEALLALQQHHPAGVLVNISEPAMNGIRFCGLVKTQDSDSRVIALHQGEPYLQQAALVAGADVVMSSPPDPLHLKKWLEMPDDGDNVGTNTVLATDTDDVLGTTAILSHDLKSPISIIISTLEVLVTIHGDDEEGNLRLLRGALSAAYRQMNLIADMLDLMRLEMGAYELECHPCNLTELVKDYMDVDAQKLTANKSLRYEINLANTPLVANLDANLTWRMLNALVDNINKFTVENDLVRIETNVSGENAILSFTDSGRPIVAGFERRIVERAPQWKDREAGTRTSVAMGLPFVFAAAKAQGGSLSAHTDPQTHLTTFMLTFPAIKVGE